MIDPRPPHALALDALGYRAAALLREGGARIEVETLGRAARCACVVDGETLSATAEHALDAVRWVAERIGRTDVVRWIDAQRDALRRAETVRPPPLD